MSETADRVKKIVVEHLGVEADKVTEDASFIDDLGADSLDTVGELRRNEDPERLVVLDACAGLSQERVRGLPATRGDDEVATDLLAVEDEAPDAALSTARDELARTCLA